MNEVKIRPFQRTFPCCRLRLVGAHPAQLHFTTTLIQDWTGEIAMSFSFIADDSADRAGGGSSGLCTCHVAGNPFVPLEPASA